MPTLQCSLQPYRHPLVLLHRRNTCTRANSRRNKQASSLPHTRPRRVNYRNVSDAGVAVTARLTEFICSASYGGGGGHNNSVPNTDFHGDDVGPPGGGYGLLGIVFTLVSVASISCCRTAS